MGSRIQMIREEYSPFKIVHHLDKIIQLKNGEQPYPLQVQIVPSNRCNNNCTFCAYRMKGYTSNEQFHDTDFLSYEKIIETIDCLADMGISATHFTGGGEPLVHPRIKDIFRYTLSKNIEVALVSNGLGLDEELCDILSEAAWVRISMDSASAKKYSSLRKVPESAFDKTVKNIECLVRKNKKAIIGVGFVVEKENYKEILQATQFYRDLGVHNFRISAAFTPEGYSYFDSFKTEAMALAKESELLSTEKFTVFNLFNDRIKDTFDGVQNYSFCPIKDLLAYIGADYNVYTCCTLAYNNRGYIGSIKNQSFKQLWESEQKTELFKKHNPSTLCRHPCMYTQKNDFINYCLKKDAKHTKYI